MANKESISAYNKEYYKNKRTFRRNQVMERQRYIRDIIQGVKLSKGCQICGYAKSARALHFHHVSNEKEHNIGRMVGQGRSVESIMLEISKCIVICANCHAEIHELEDKDMGL